MIPDEDADEAFAFMVSQLSYTEARAYERYYQPMNWGDLAEEMVDPWTDATP